MPKFATFLSVLVAAAISNATRSAASDPPSVPSNSVPAPPAHDGELTPEIFSSKRAVDAETANVMDGLLEELDKNSRGGSSASADSRLRRIVAVKSDAAVRFGPSKDEDEGEQTNGAALREAMETALRRIDAGENASRDGYALVREAVNSGYFVVWAMLDNDERDQAARLIGRFQRAIASHQGGSLPPELYLPSVRLAWLKARYYSELIGILSPTDAVTTRDGFDRDVLNLTRGSNIYGPDRIELIAMRSDALSLSRGGLETDWNESCESIRAIYGEAPRIALLRRLVRCSNESVANVSAVQEIDRVEQLLEASRTLIDEKERGDRVADRAAYPLLKATVDLTESDFAELLPERERSMRLKKSAADNFIAGVSRPIYSQSYLMEMFNIYLHVRDVDRLVIAPGDADVSKKRAAIEYLEAMYAAVSRRQSEFPKSPLVALIRADLAAKLADWYVSLSDFDHAEEASARAVEAVAIARPIDRATEFTTMAEIECGAYASRVRASVSRRNTAETLHRYEELTTICGAWFRKFPWDYPARKHLVDVGGLVGRLLVEAGNVPEAMDILTFSSNWGDRASSRLLADIYRTGRGGIAVDAAKALALATLGRRQVTQSITVPAVADRRRYPFVIHPIEYAQGTFCPIQSTPLPVNFSCAGFAGIDDQSQWLQSARGGRMRIGDTSSFRRMGDLARRSSVSFPDLAFYAFRGRIGSRPGSLLRRKSRVSSLVNMDRLRHVRPEIIAVDKRTPSAVTTAAKTIPYRIGTSCYGWDIRVADRYGRITLTEILDLPAAPSRWNVDSERSTVSANRRRVISRVPESASDGLLHHSWCIAEGDPSGWHRFRVKYGQQLLFDGAFKIERRETQD